MDTIKICIVLTVLALMARYASRFLMAGESVNPAMAKWIDRLHFHWIGIVWILFMLPYHPFSLILAAGTLLWSARQVRQFPLVTLLFLLLTIPTIERRISGVAGIDSLIFFGWPLALSLAIYWLCRSRPGKWADIHKTTRWLIVLFFLFVFFLSFRGTSFTDGLRTALNYFAMIFLTASIVSKARSEDWIAGVVYAIVAVGLLTAFISTFEAFRSWLLLAPMQDLYGSGGSLSISLYKYRGGYLRSVVAHGTLQTGLILSTALIALVLIRRQLSSHWVFFVLFGILAVGLLGTFSRGPILVGGLVVLMFELFRSRSSSIPKLMMFFGMLYGVLVFSGAIDILQGMFQIKDDFNFNYRVRLFDESVDVIMNHFMVGTSQHVDILAARGLRQGEGIVDIVNTYLQVGLQYGGVALAIYVLMLLHALTRGVSRIKIVSDQPNAKNSVNVYWLALSAVMVNAFIQSSSVSVLGYESIFVFLLLLVLVSSSPLNGTTSSKKNEHEPMIAVGTRSGA